MKTPVTLQAATNPTPPRYRRSRNMAFGVAHSGLHVPTISEIRRQVERVGGTRGEVVATFDGPSRKYPSCRGGDSARI